VNVSKIVELLARAVVLRLVLRPMNTSGNTLKKLIRTAAPVLAGAAIALTGAAATANAAASSQASTVPAPASTQVTSCFAARPDVPYYSWPAWRDRGAVTYLGKVGQGQGLYWYGTTFINGYAYRIGTLWGGPGDVMLPGIYMNC
jgi:hypothetical protein